MTHFMFISGITVRMDTRLEDFMVKLSIDALQTENGRQKYHLSALKLSKIRIMVRYYTTAKHFLKFESLFLPISYKTELFFTDPFDQVMCPSHNQIPHTDFERVDGWLTSNGAVHGTVLEYSCQVGLINIVYYS